MKKRTKLSARTSKRLYRKTVNLTKSVNLAPPPMRGGIRM